LTVTLPLLSLLVFKTALPSKKRTCPVGVGPALTACTFAVSLTIDAEAGLAGKYERVIVGGGFAIVPEYLAVR